MEVSDHEVGVTIPIQVGCYYRTSVVTEPESRCKMRIDESVTLAGKKPVELAAGKALRPVSADSLGTTTEEVLVVFVFVK